MSLPLAYVDTSAFIKRFIDEKGTAEIESFIADQRYKLVLSSLSIVELKSVLKRKVRLAEVNEAIAGSINEQISIEISSQALGFHTIDAATFELAGNLIQRLASSLGTLDAIHLACARTAYCTMMVSADKQLLRASSEAGLQTLDLS